MYFSEGTDPKIDWQRVSQDSLLRLEMARSASAKQCRDRDIPDFAWKITSNYRTPEHSIEVGGLNNDAHTQNPCGAFDVAFADTFQVFIIVSCALDAGFKRIGINPINKHVHLDTAQDLPTPRIWIEGIMK